ncbi:MAG: hypothetical protein JWM22_1253 [Frankiales bacterium]|jgi:hypothetical protein|nr:hypothetical protein [Frankiales bacterium]
MTASAPDRRTVEAVTLPLSAPTVFSRAVEGLQSAIRDVDRPGVLSIHEVPAPRRLAPHAVAFSAEVLKDGDEVATGRFVVLHDPEGQDGWRGDTRVVAFVSADVDAEMAGDPALAAVGWSWLKDSLDGRAAGHQAAGGTVTRTASLTFGLVEDPQETNEVEVRASWSPVHEADGSLDLGVHLMAWCDLLCMTAGLPPVGITRLR